jgi:hypothetical protein
MVPWLDPAPGGILGTPETAGMAPRSSSGLGIWGGGQAFGVGVALTCLFSFVSSSQFPVIVVNPGLLAGAPFCACAGACVGTGATFGRG